MSNELFITINTILTPISLLLSFFVLGYAIRSFVSIKKPKNKPVAISLVAIGILFSLYAIISEILYTLILIVDITSVQRAEVSGVRSILTNVMIIAISFLMIRIYRNKL